MDKIILYTKRCITEKFADFTGRARREEFWYFYLATCVFYAVVGILGRIPYVGMVISLIGGLAGLALIVPTLAAGARRLHDTGRSGWFQLISLVPFVGTIILIVFWAQEGVAGSNKWGNNPKTQA